MLHASGRDAGQVEERRQNVLSAAELLPLTRHNMPRPSHQHGNAVAILPDQRLVAAQFGDIAFCPILARHGAISRILLRLGAGGAVVADEDNDCALILTGFLQALQQAADAFVHLRNAPVAGGETR